MEEPICVVALFRTREDEKRRHNFIAALAAHGIHLGDDPPPPRSRDRNSKCSRKVAKMPRREPFQCGICSYRGQMPVGGDFRKPYGGTVVPGTPCRSTASGSAYDCEKVCKTCWEVDKSVREAADRGWAAVQGGRAPAAPSRAAGTSELAQLEVAHVLFA